MARWLKEGRLFGPEPRFDWAIRDLGRVLIGLRAALKRPVNGDSASMVECLTEANRLVADAITALEAVHILDEDAGYRNMSMRPEPEVAPSYTIKVTHPDGTTAILHEGPGAWDDSPRRPIVFISLHEATGYAAARQRAFPDHKYAAEPAVAP